MNEYYDEELEDDFVPDRSRVDYSKVEDIAGVDYKQAAIFTAIYIFLHFFVKDYLSFFPIIWVVASTALSVTIWLYFKKYFEAVNDHATGKWINGVIAAYLLFGLIVLGSSRYLNIEHLIDLRPAAIERLFNTVFQLTLIPVIILFIVCFKIITVNSRHPFPLKRIAVSAMLIIPVYMLITLVENMPLIGEGITLLNVFILIMDFAFDVERSGHAVGYFQVGFWGNVVLMVPYYFLFFHFYRADREDATPDDEW